MNFVKKLELLCRKGKRTLVLLYIDFLDGVLS